MAHLILPVLSSALGIGVYFLLLASGPNQVKASCMVEDMLFVVGHQWTERCRNCTCTNHGTRCTGPVCALPYSPTHEYQCAQWEDECCCQVLGCKLSNGSILALGTPLPRAHERPCHYCRCHGQCYLEWCPFVSFHCQNAVRREGQCCLECQD